MVAGRDRMNRKGNHMGQPDGHMAIATGAGQDWVAKMCCSWFRKALRFCVMT